MLLPSLLLCVYPTRMYRYLSRFVSSRKRLAITAFVEALHNCFKDGTRDYRMLAGFLSSGVSSAETLELTIIISPIISPLLVFVWVGYIITQRMYARGSIIDPLLSCSLASILTSLHVDPFLLCSLMHIYLKCPITLSMVFFSTSLMAVTSPVDFCEEVRIFTEAVTKQNITTHV